MGLILSKISTNFCVVLMGDFRGFIPRTTTLATKKMLYQSASKMEITKLREGKAPHPPRWLSQENQCWLTAGP
jgi:hypothetical protein